LRLIAARLTTCYKLRVVLGPLLCHINNLGTISVLLSLCGLDNLRLISLIIIIRCVIFNRCSRIYYLLLLIVVMIFIEVMIWVVYNQILLVSHQLTLIVLIDNLVMLVVVFTKLLLRIDNRVVMVLILIDEVWIIYDLINIIGFVFSSQYVYLVAILMVRHLLLRDVLLLRNLLLLLLLGLSLML